MSSRVRGTRLRADFGFWILDGEILTRVNLVTARRVHMWGAREVIRAEAWRDPASLLTARIRMELRRAGEKSSWGGGEGGEGSACVFGEADGFEVGHFGIGVRRGAGDGSFEEGNTVGGKRG